MNANFKVTCSSYLFHCLFHITTQYIITRSSSEKKTHLRPPSLCYDFILDRMDAIDSKKNFTLDEDIIGPLLAAVVGIEMVAGLITNSFVLILTLCLIKDWKQPSIIFLTNMLLNNLVITLLVMPFSIITAASGEWIFGSTVNQKESVCQFAACLFSYSFFTAIESLVLVSFDRFFFIVKALQYKKYMTANKAVIIVAVSWILAAFFSILPLLGFGANGFIPSCGLCATVWEGQIGYSIFFFVISLIFVGSIIVTSIWTLCFTRKYLTNTATGPIPTDTQGSNVYAPQQRKIIKLFGMLILVHLLCYAPGLIVIFISLFTPLPAVPYAIIFVSYLLLTSLIPLVQSFFRRDIKETIAKIWPRCLNKVRHGVRTSTVTSSGPLHQMT